MYLRNLFSSAVILLFLAIEIQCQESGTCHVWGDPHLIMFPMQQSLTDSRAVYWCKSPGRMVMLKNKFLEVAIQVTEQPWYNENYEIKILNSDSVACTITHGNHACIHPFVQIDENGNTIDITILNADLLTVTVTAHPVQTSNIYDIMITQSYPLIRESSGLCIARNPSCRLEKGANLFGTRRRRNLNVTAERICDQYMQEGYKTAQNLMGNRGSRITAFAQTACIDDVASTGDSTWAESAINFVVMDALHQAHFNNVQRREKMKETVPAIIIANARARNNTKRDLDGLYA